jgi:competence protein ComGC
MTTNNRSQAGFGVIEMFLVMFLVLVLILVFTNCVSPIIAQVNHSIEVAQNAGLIATAVPVLLP